MVSHLRKPENSLACSQPLSPTPPCAPYKYHGTPSSQQPAAAPEQAPSPGAQTSPGRGAARGFEMHFGFFNVPEKDETFGGRGRILHFPESTPRGGGISARRVCRAYEAFCGATLRVGTTKIAAHCPRCALPEVSAGCCQNPACAIALLTTIAKLLEWPVNAGEPVSQKLPNRLRPRRLRIGMRGDPGVDGSKQIWM